jgi:hypothetical protein
MVHALPAATALAVVFVCSPKTRWLAVLAGYIGIYVGVKADTWLAWITLGAEGFQAHKVTAKGFVSSNLGVYSQFLASPSIASLLDILATIPKNLAAAKSYVGGELLSATALTLIGLGSLAAAARRALCQREMLHVLLAFAAASTAVVIWWSGMPSAPTRFLTSVAPLSVVSLAAAIVALLSSCRTLWRTVVMLGVGIFLIYSTSQLEHRGGFDSRVGQAVREEQREVAQVLRITSAREKKKPLCGEGWWYPHEISFLTASPKTISCGVDRASGVVIPKHIFPAEIASQLFSERCEKAFSGAYYDLAYCRRAGGD